MGGGPSHWAARDHAKAGYPIYATPQAAKTFDDNLENVENEGIRVISDDESNGFADTVVRIELQDFNYDGIVRSFNEFGVSLDQLDAVAVAVFDHGAAPPNISDRQFRFDFLDENITKKNRLSAFAFRSDDIPPIMSRLQAVADSASGIDAPLLVMDTAPAAILGATFDPLVGNRERVMVANVGNFHTLAFRLGISGIEGVFEHHTGLLDLPKLEELLRALADGSLKHEHVFGDHGHGALIYDQNPLSLNGQGFGIAVTGPRRNMMTNSSLRPYFPAPFGDMMISGCFGLLAAVADIFPELAEPIQVSLLQKENSSIAPWDVS
jgi:uncharacterized protein (DUF1786 family)